MRRDAAWTAVELGIASVDALAHPASGAKGQHAVRGVSP
jgi:hypothetical protein